MSPSSRDRLWWGAAALLAVPALFFPIYNPDLFWHLAAGRWILEHGVVPRADAFSFTAAGSPWLDFEWLSQVLFQAAYAAAGFGGLWALKTALLAAGWLPLDRVLKLHGLPVPARAAALALWSAGTLGFSDIRPELFSLLFLGLQLWGLEAHRLGRLKAGPAAWAALAGLHALWANLHAAFFLGLTVLLLYVAEAAARRSWREAGRLAAGLAAAGLGSLLNPYGAGPYRVAWEHWLMREELTRYIKEWRPLTAENPLHWPLWALLWASAGAALALAASRRRDWRRWPWPLLLTGAYFACGALRHTRLAAYFNLAAVLALPAMAAELGWLSGSRPWKRVLAGCLVCQGLYLGYGMPRVNWSSFFNGKYVPRRAAEFLARENDALGGLRLYNQWEWGGYLSWRLGPGHKTFGDGRYIFHHQLAALGEASSQAGSWQDLMRRERLQGAVVRNLGTTLPTRKLYPDGSSREFQRPWYVFYMPVDRWALVYWDEQALVFVERAAVPAAWLSGREYRYLRPGDGEALDEALKRGEVPEKKVAAEAERHGEELRKSVEALSRG